MAPIFSPGPGVALGPARRPERSSTRIVRLAKSLTNELRAAGLPGQVVALITHIVVSAVDPAFQDPSKPIGSVYTQEAERLRRVEGWPIAEDAGRGCRRVVPSPRLEALQAQGQFSPGSKGPKREAALQFVRSGGRAALITSVAWLLEPVRGVSGTRLVADEDLVVA
jgi:carbamate kinase